MSYISYEKIKKLIFLSPGLLKSHSSDITFEAGDIS